MLAALAALARSASSQMIIGSEPPSSSVTRLEPFAASAGDVLADRRRPGEGHLAHERVGDERLARLRAGAGQHGQHALGEPGLGEDLPRAAAS